MGEWSLKTIPAGSGQSSSLVNSAVCVWFFSEFLFANKKVKCNYVLYYNILRIRVVMSSNRHEYLIRRHLIWQSFASSCMNNKAH